MPNKNLYCIALLPDPAIREHVRMLKEEMNRGFGARHALKSPAHITLQMPFRREDAQEEHILEVLKDHAAQQSTFRVDLKDFGCFAPKVIFVKIEDHREITDLHAGLRTVLEQQIGLSQKEIMHKVYPHMTIATRDLTRTAFKKAWAEFQLRNFSASFEVNSIHLLKHNGKYWDIFREFPFNE